MSRVRVRRPLLALVALVALLAVGYGVNGARTHHGPSHPAATSTPGRTPLSALPPQVAHTVRLIEQGGPYPYPRNDGTVFHNNEHLLPAEPGGYYHEYTVPTPGSPDRGGRRIITGAHGEFYYTPDHYEAFVRVDLTPRASG